MEIKDVKLFLDSCHAAKRIVELMPKLPKGLTPQTYSCYRGNLADQPGIWNGKNQ